MAAAAAMTNEQAGCGQAALLLRLLTPLIKFRACRDNLAVATGAMEVRGGNGYIEEWVTARLVRDAQLGVLWEGTSSITALDAIARAVGRAGAQTALQGYLHERLKETEGLPQQFVGRLAAALSRALQLAERVAESGREAEARRAASALYHAASAVLLAAEGARGADATRALHARFVLEHRLTAQDPLQAEEARWEAPAIALLLDGAEVPRTHAEALLT
jgi:hypothetical protein